MTYDEMMKQFTPEEQAEIKRGADEMVAVSRALRHHQDEFTKAVRRFIRKYHTGRCIDVESCHYCLDQLMEETLIALGFDKGVKLIRKTGRWYA
jgi:hypothetical protein